MKIMYNLWKFGYSTWKYPRNWWSNIKQFFKNFKRMNQRIKHGWCDCDTWDMCSTDLIRFAQMVRFLAANHTGYPIKFEEYGDDMGSEIWSQTLLTMASTAEKLSDAYDIGSDYTLEGMKKLNDEFFDMLKEEYAGLWD